MESPIGKQQRTFRMRNRCDKVNLCSQFTETSRVNSGQWHPVKGVLHQRTITATTPLGPSRSDIYVNNLLTFIVAAQQHGFLVIILANRGHLLTRLSATAHHHLALVAERLIAGRGRVLAASLQLCVLSSACLIFLARWHGFLLLLLVVIGIVCREAHASILTAYKIDKFTEFFKLLLYRGQKDKVYYSNL